MKKVQLLLLLLSAVLSTGCSIYNSYGFSYDQLREVRQGMSFKEVTAVLGDPVYRDLDDKGESWEFRALGMTGWSVVKIWFKDEKVVEMKSYLEREHDCNKSQSKPVSGLSNHEFKYSTDEISKTEVLVTPDGKHALKIGSLIVTPDGQHIHAH